MAEAGKGEIVKKGGRRGRPVMYVCKRCSDQRYGGASRIHFRVRGFRRCEECGKMILPGKKVYVV